MSDLKGGLVLERIDFIKNVGLFSDYSQEPGTDFDELTLIFGENGVGKTTIAAIVDSLRERSSTAITRRRSLPGNCTPTCGISLDGTAYAFDGSDWDGQPAHDTVEVFFPDFVSRNVHAGGGVETEHRRNLCEFVLGRAAVTDVEKLADADSEARAALSDIRHVDEKLKLLIKSPDPVEAFVELPEDPEVDAHIAKARAAVDEAVAAEKVIARAVPVPVRMAAPAQAQVLDLLALTDTSIAADVAEIVGGHVGAVLDEDGERWLDYGTQHIVDDRCPYCGQDLTGIALVEFLREYFGAAYRGIVASVSSGVASARSASAESVVEKARSEVQAQLVLAAQWNEQYALDGAAIDEHLDAAETLWVSGAKQLEAVLDAKQSSPLEIVSPDEVDAAFDDFHAAVAHIDAVSTLLAECATAAEAHKKALAAADKIELGQKLARLEDQKTRYSEPALALLRDREAHATRRKDAEEEKVRLKAAIEVHANAVVGKYEAGINYYLQHLGCEIRIGTVEAAFPAGRASVSFKLTVRGQDVPLGALSENPCFGNVLSEGDKCSLALAFFLARLKDTADLTGRIIVLDDPVNSLGGSRRRLVEGVIRDLRKRGAQVVVLTHDERLAAMLWRDSSKIGAMKKIVALQVERTATGSRIASWDAERATRSEYVEDYLTLVGFLEGSVDETVAAGCIRPYVEQRLRHLFPGPPLESRDTLGMMISKIRAAQPGDRLHGLQSNLLDLEAINDAGLPAAHASDDVPGMPPLSREEVRVFAQKALDVLP